MPNIKELQCQTLNQSIIWCIYPKIRNSSEQVHDNKWHPIAYASRSLTLTETNHPIPFACQYFHERVYGQHFIVYNNHKPFKSIMNEQITKAQPRIQCFFLRIQKYDFDLEYTKGKLMQVVGHTMLGRITRQHPWNIQQRNKLLCPLYYVITPNQWKESPETGD